MDAGANKNEEVVRLFFEHVPEVATGVVTIKSIAREPGQRTIVAVHSTDPPSCPMLSCIGLRGVRIKAIIASLAGEKVDVIRWSDSIEDLIRNVASPARLDRVVYDAANNTATIYARRDYRALIIGRQGSRLELMSQLVGCKIRVIDT